MSCQVVAPSKTMRALSWAGLSLFRVLRKRDLRFTGRLNQEKCQATGTSVCSGEKSPSFFLLPRSGNEWVVATERYGAPLKANTQEDPLTPPTTGWKFYNFDTRKYEEDPQLQCTSTPSSPPCSVTVSLTGRAKEFQGESDGKYEETGLRSAGRKVIWISMIICSTTTYWRQLREEITTKKRLNSSIAWIT